MTAMLIYRLERPGTSDCNYADGCRSLALWGADGDRIRFCGPCKIQAELAGRVATTEKAIEQNRRKAADAKAKKVQPEQVEDGTCGCGCGEPATRTFRPGHDSKLKARRRKAGLDPLTGGAL